MQYLMKLFVIPFFLLLVLAANAYSDYHVIYDKGWVVDYYDEGVLKRDIRYDFKDLYNYLDPKVVCSNSTWNCATPDQLPDELTVNLHTTSRKDSTGNPYTYSFDPYFCIYIPKGAVSFLFEIQTDYNAETMLAMRYKTPVEGDYSDRSYSDDRNIMEVDSLMDLQDQDQVFKRKSREFMTPLDVTFSSPLGDGGWLYVKTLGEQGTINVMKIDMAVKLSGSDDFDEWYDGVNWVEGEPPGMSVSSDPSNSGSTDSGDSGDSGAPVPDSDVNLTDHDIIGDDERVDLKDALEILKKISQGDPNYTQDDADEILKSLCGGN